MILPKIAEGLFPASQYTDLRRDMARFDKVFGLPRPPLRLVNSIARSGSPWQTDGEEVLDAEMIHTAAPGAAITIVLIKPSSFTDARAGVAAAGAVLRLATSQQASVVSISAAGQTGGENCDTPSEVKLLNSSLRAAVVHRITIVTASGDIGAVGEPCDLAKGLTGGSFPPIKEVNVPASDPLVLAAAAPGPSSKPREAASAACLPGPATRIAYPEPALAEASPTSRPTPVRPPEWR